MRIVFCITDLDWGGAEQALVEVVVRTVAHGIRCRVLVLAPPPPPHRRKLVARLEQAGVEVVFLAIPHRPGAPNGPAEAQHPMTTGHQQRSRTMPLVRKIRSAWFAPWILRRLLQELQEFQPRIVQSYLFHANLIACIAARRAGKLPVVTGIRVAERRRNLHRWLARRTDPLVARHVCVSQAVAHFAEQSMGLAPHKLVVIPNGVDRARFHQANPVALDTMNVPPQARILASIGRLDQQKRFDWLLAQVPELITRIPELHALLVGDGPERAALERLAHRLGITGHVHFTGWRDDIPNILAAAEMLVLTSAWEGMPNVVLEAMAASRPVVSTACEGVAELLGSGATDQVVAANDGPGLIAAIENFARNRTLAVRIGSDNFQRAAAFSWDTTAAAYLATYRELIGSV